MIIRLGIDEINYEECFENLIPQMIADAVQTQSCQNWKNCSSNLAMTLFPC